MSQAPVVLLDASRMAWRDFAAALMGLRTATARDGVFAYVRPPMRCAREAGRLVRDLDLADAVELLAPDAPDPQLRAVTEPAPAAAGGRAAPTPPRTLAA